VEVKDIASTASSAFACVFRQGERRKEGTRLSAELRYYVIRRDPEMAMTWTLATGLEWPHGAAATAIRHKEATTQCAQYGHGPENSDEGAKE